MTKRIDARDLLCPLPVLRLRKGLIGASPGTRVVLVATDRAALVDVPHFCAESGHLLISMTPLVCGATEFLVERGPDA
ncbi:sulfurtransferase TusA family protein [Paracoccus sp. MBLB3053]|uniref:Sulfurtransferase TusA family protein n=1 Tax=Paracoccus aurantius TaxID=3073814 RepID=A0ABU2HNK5_9RHOB|nr:sulfurtransferase TusA family protein [Paracoccus sp. MBLB3053]MDS9466608.1 sulfurtransferase TusA family protein [Paracoccus sp. MBLB3053]